MASTNTTSNDSATKKVHSNPKKRTVSFFEAVKVLEFNPIDGPSSVAGSTFSEQELGEPTKKRARFNAPLAKEEEEEEVDGLTKVFRRFAVIFPGYYPDYFLE